MIGLRHRRADSVHVITLFYTEIPLILYQSFKLLVYRIDLQVPVHP